MANKNEEKKPTNYYKKSTNTNPTTNRDYTPQEQAVPTFIMTYFLLQV